MRAQVKVTPIFLSIELDSLEFETHWEREGEREREQNERSETRASLSHAQSLIHSLSSLSLSLSLSFSSSAVFLSSPAFLRLHGAIDRSIDRSKKKISRVTKSAETKREFEK